MTVPNQQEPLTNGAAWAAILACGIGRFAFGVFTDFAEATKLGSRLMDFYDPAGNLSGKSALAILVWIVVWITLHVRWRNRQIRSTRRLTAAALALIILGIAAASPFVFEVLPHT